MSYSLTVFQAGKKNIHKLHTIPKYRRIKFQSNQKFKLKTIILLSLKSVFIPPHETVTSPSPFP
jgi:hypothetical protein